MSAQFDVCRLSNGSLVVVVQADAVAMYDTRVVVPLVEWDGDAAAVNRLTPSVVVNGQTWVLATHMISVVHRTALSPAAGSLVSKRLVIQAALDLLFNGS